MTAFQLSCAPFPGSGQFYHYRYAITVPNGNLEIIGKIKNPAHIWGVGPLPISGIEWQDTTFICKLIGYKSKLICAIAPDVDISGTF